MKKDSLRPFIIGLTVAFSLGVLLPLIQYWLADRTLDYPMDLFKGILGGITSYMAHIYLFPSQKQKK